MKEEECHLASLKPGMKEQEEMRKEEGSLPVSLGVFLPFSPPPPPPTVIYNISTLLAFCFFQKPSVFAVLLPLTLLSFTKKANSHCFHIFFTELSSLYLPAPPTLRLGWILISLRLHHSLPSPFSKQTCSPHLTRSSVTIALLSHLLTVLHSVSVSSITSPS